MFSSIPHDRLRAIDAQFVRVFDGEGTDADIRDLARLYDCKVVVITPQDGAWTRDPFADSRWYERVDEKPERWRIYRMRQEGAGPNR